MELCQKCAPTLKNDCRLSASEKLPTCATKNFSLLPEESLRFLYRTSAIKLPKGSGAFWHLRRMLATLLSRKPCRSHPNNCG